MKELPYFKNYVDEYLTGDIRLCSYETQGVFAILKCLCWKKGGYLSGDIDELSRLSGIEKPVITNAITMLLQHDIICYNKQNLLYIKFILEQLEEMTNISEKRGKAGKIGMRKRWQQQGVKPNSETDNKCYNSVITNGITKHNNIDQEEDKEEDKDIKENIKKKFTPPTFEEFKKYCETDLKEYQLDPENIFKGYELNNWHDSQGTQILNWKMKLRQVWCKYKKISKLSPGQNYQQEGEPNWTHQQ